VVRVEYDSAADNELEDEDEDTAMERRHDEVREEFQGVKDLQRQMDERMKTLEDNVATLQRNVDQKLSDIGRMLGELLAARA
jgi:prophage DNA circulation protein